MAVVVFGSDRVGTLVVASCFDVSARGNVSGRKMLEFSGVGRNSSDIVMPTECGVNPASSSEHAGGGDRSGVFDAKSSVCSTR